MKLAYTILIVQSIHCCMHSTGMGNTVVTQSMRSDVLADPFWCWLKTRWIPEQPQVFSPHRKTKEADFHCQGGTALGSVVPGQDGLRPHFYLGYRKKALSLQRKVFTCQLILVNNPTEKSTCISFSQLQMQSS